MAHKASVTGEADQSVAALETAFITKQQTASLMQGLELTVEEIDQVSGGLPRIREPFEVPDCIVAPPPDCIVVPPADCILA